MKINLHTKEMPNESLAEVEALSTCECTEFLIGWLKRSGKTLTLFVFPYEH